MKQLLQGIDDAVDKVRIVSQATAQRDRGPVGTRATVVSHSRAACAPHARTHALCVRRAARDRSVSVDRHAAAFAIKHAAMRHAI